MTSVKDIASQNSRLNRECHLWSISGAAAIYALQQQDRPRAPRQNGCETNPRAHLSLRRQLRRAAD